MLEKLSNAFGPSGFEWEVQVKLKEYVQAFADEIQQDKTGTLIFTSKGDVNGPKIMIAGHVDEIGFQVSAITKEGYLKFHQLGGWWDQTLLSQRVLIKTSEGKLIPGIIAAKPPHIVDPEERKKVVTKDKMFIDIGCASKAEAEELGLRIGDPMMPDSKFEIWNRTRIKKKDGEIQEKKDVKLAVGKAFDDRAGAVITAEIIRKIKEENISHPNVVFGAATVQEEVGLRGAKTAAQMIKPDIGIALEVDIAGDVPGIDETQAPTKMGKGPSILTYDRSMIPNPRYRDFVIKIAEELGIPHQLSLVTGGATDAGVIHLTELGCPSIVIGIPTRHIHAHNGIIDLSDIDNAIKLILELIRRLDRETVESFTKI
ncbi:MAG: M42 family metallopeptidase [Candidatus Heimdallarchaeota archaeon]|nr:M42 family metallopeptidase [Candidatus Heimdallarchaeota archaeon]MCK4876752.1 M42 family metallopeptidase [Candidatus Heimdallarchaeota archaeon]